MGGGRKGGRGLRYSFRRWEGEAIGHSCEVFKKQHRILWNRKEGGEKKGGGLRGNVGLRLF